MIVKRVRVDYYEVNEEKYHKWFMENIYDPYDPEYPPIEAAKKESLFLSIEDDEQWWSEDWWSPYPGGGQIWTIEKENEEKR